MNNEGKNYFRGLIGSLIGAILFSIPWILMYVYGEMILSALGMVIGFGAHKFYKLFGGKDGDKTPLIVVASSIIAITVATFIIIPIFLIFKEGTDLGYFSVIYSNSEFVSAIIKDFILSIVFTLLGVSAVVASIKKSNLQQENGSDFADPYFMKDDEKIKYIEEIFNKYNAFSKETAVSEFKILKEVKSAYRLRLLLQLEFKGIIYAPFFKAYFDKEAVTNPEKAKKNHNKANLVGILAGIAIGLIIVALIFGIIFIFEKDNSNESKNKKEAIEELVEENEQKYKTFEFKNISIELKDSFEETDKTDNVVTYVNRDNNILKVVTISQETINYNKALYQSYKNNYITYLKNTMNIMDEKELNSSLDGFYLKTCLKSNENLEYHIFVMLDPNNLYIVLFGGDVTERDNSIKSINESILKSEAEFRMSTFKIDNETV